MLMKQKELKVVTEHTKGEKTYIFFDHMSNFLGFLQKIYIFLSTKLIFK